MGVSLSFYCKKCLEQANLDSNPIIQWSFFLGVGMMYSRTNVFEGNDGKPLLFDLIQSTSVKKNAEEFLRKGYKSCDEYGYEIYFCLNCNNFIKGFYFKLIKDKDFYEPDYSCSKCEKSLIRVKFEEKDGKLFINAINGNTIHWKCSSCGGDELVKNQIQILWD
jgi:hypothetical protein